MNDLTPAQSQWAAFCFMAGVTAMIVVYEVLMLRLSPRLTISGVVAPFFNRTPFLFLSFAFWLGTMVGHWVFRIQ